MGFKRQLLQSVNFTEENMFENITSNNGHDEDQLFPDEIFTNDQLKSGAIILYIVGVIYMIYGLVFLYKEFFIPSLFVVIHKFSCTEDVAGGVVLAIGFLLPELIHNSIAIFIAYPGDLGLGKYVGSVSFNLLIYLGIAACVGRSLQLSGLCIGREFIFQFISILVLFAFMIDNVLQSYELIILILMYGIYCILLKFNGRIKNFMKNKCSRPTSKTGELQLDDHNPASSEPANQEGLTSLQALTESILNENPLTLKLSDRKTTYTGYDKTFFVIWFPLIAIFWLLLNWFDVRKPGKRNYFAINYVLSIALIRAMAYLIVWWCTIIGDTFEIPPQVMGLTLMAIAFNMPIFYLIMKCAQNCCGDLILSMTSGINILNMTLGLGLPNLIYNIVFNDNVKADSAGMICSAVLMVIIMVAIVSFLACFRRNLSKALGIIYIVIYILFVLISLGFAYNFVKCPV